MMQLISRFARDERGATAIEYALIGVLVSVAIVVGAGALGSKLYDMFVAINDKFAAAG